MADLTSSSLESRGRFDVILVGELWADLTSFSLESCGRFAPEVRVWVGISFNCIACSEIEIEK